jgi:hypothetical protein
VRLYGFRFRDLDSGGGKHPTIVSKTPHSHARNLRTPSPSESFSPSRFCKGGRSSRMYLAGVGGICDLSPYPPLLTSPPTGGRSIGGLTPPNPPKAAFVIELNSESWNAAVSNANMPSPSNVNAHIYSGPKDSIFTCKASPDIFTKRKLFSIEILPRGCGGRASAPTVPPVGGR